MRYDLPLLPATFLKREKRFSVLARLSEGSGESPEVWCHCPNPGRLTSCLDRPGIPLFLSSISPNPKNPGGYLFRTEQSEPLPGIRVGINPNRANTLALEAILDPEKGLCPKWRHGSSEVALGERSRIDHLFFDEQGGRWFVEVKSVTYREGEAALFPDAVSERAVRHLEELSRAAEKGDHALLLFVVGRGDCRFVAPADHVHPAYREALVAARAAGVVVRGVAFIPGDGGFALEGELPVVF
ncbi:MAG: DNA/RNA nuclease SfsA [Leptospirillia bacterium]